MASPPNAKYFSKMVKFFCRQCIGLNGMVTNASGYGLRTLILLQVVKQINLGLRTDNILVTVCRNPEPDLTSKILSAVDEIEDTLYYFSDIISAGIPDVGRLMTDKILKHLVFQLLLPSLRTESTQVNFLTFLICQMAFFFFC